MIHAYFWSTVVEIFAKHWAVNQNGSRLLYCKTIEVKEHTKLERVWYYKLLTFCSTDYLYPWLQCKLVNLAFTHILLKKQEGSPVWTKVYNCPVLKTASDVLCDLLYVTISHSQRHKKRILIVIYLNPWHYTVFHIVSEVVRSFFCRLFC